jgi:hypothetical protein
MMIVCRTTNSADARAISTLPRTESSSMPSFPQTPPLFKQMLNIAVRPMVKPMTRQQPPPTISHMYYMLDRSPCIVQVR